MRRVTVRILVSALVVAGCSTSDTLEPSSASSTASVPPTSVVSTTSETASTTEPTPTTNLPTTTLDATTSVAVTSTSVPPGSADTVSVLDLAGMIDSMAPDCRAAIAAGESNLTTYPGGDLTLDNGLPHTV